MSKIRTGGRSNAREKSSAGLVEPVAAANFAKRLLAPAARDAALRDTVLRRHKRKNASLVLNSQTRQHAARFGCEEVGLRGLPCLRNHLSNIVLLSGEPL